MDFNTATALRDSYEARLREASKALKSIEGVGTGLMGLTPDIVKNTPDYIEHRRRLDYEFRNLREFNAWYTKQFAKELRAERNKKFA